MIECPGGDNLWCEKGVLHRLDGTAVDELDWDEYWINGRY